MVFKTKISIFICGQKVNLGNEIVNSPGVIEEYKISKANGNLIIPISSTGGAASSIWDMENNDKSFSSQFEEFQSLRTEVNPDKIVDLVMSIITKFNKKYQ